MNFVIADGKTVWRGLTAVEYYNRGRTPHLDKFGTHKRRAKNHGIEFLLTFSEWLKIWADSGHFHERGIKKGQYVMARFGDKGPYAIGNVKIITNAENVSEAHKGRPKSEEHRAKIGNAHLGMKRSAAAKANMRAGQRKRRSALYDYRNGRRSDG